MFDRFDICEAYAALEYDWNTSGWLQERPSCQRRREAVHVQLHRIGFRARPSLSGYESLSENGQDIYRAACARLGLPFDAVTTSCPHCDGEDDYCPLCNGVGRVSQGQADEWHRQND